MMYGTLDSQLQIRLATPLDFKQYCDLLQQTYVACCTNDAIGLTRECFSREMLTTQESVDFLHSYINNTPTHKAWVVELDGKIIGTITCEFKSEREAEIIAFYVLPEFQHRGIGRRLYRLALDFAGSRDIILDVYSHNEQAITMYKKWGFEFDQTRGKHGSFYLHWQGWPDDVRVKCLYMRLKQRML